MFQRRNNVKDSIFAGLLIVAGAILVAGSEISSGIMGAYVGLPLICWGIAERIIVLIKNKKQK